MFKTLFNSLKYFFIHFGALLLWLLPLALFLLVTYLPTILWNIDFKSYIGFLEVLIWPYTVLVILFFFKKVVTYLFFSMDQFSFFGTKGNLRNVNEVILEEVNNKFKEKENDEKRKIDMAALQLTIAEKDIEVSEAKGRETENIGLAEEIMKRWKKSTKEIAETIKSLESDNRRLREITELISHKEIANPPHIDGNLTSDSILEEDSTD